MLAAVVCTGSQYCIEAVSKDVSTQDEADEFCRVHKNWRCAEHSRRQPWWQCEHCHALNYPIYNVCQGKGCGMPQPK